MHPSLRRLLAGLALTTVAVAGCATASSAGAIDRHPATAAGAGHTARASGAQLGAEPSGSAARPLAGKVIGIDPGHNGDNYAHPSYINQTIWNGRENESCDTTGTATNAGYTEALFNWRVAKYLVHDLHKDGAKVVLTRHSNHGYGPCVTTRAKILNRANPAVSIDIHADGGPASGRGFAILEPVADGPNDHVIKSSERFAHDLKTAMLRRTSMPTSTYDGVNGFTHRDDLAGLNLTTEPKVLIEVGNMRNGTDAGKLSSSSFQKRAAAAMAAAIVRFVG